MEELIGSRISCLQRPGSEPRAVCAAVSHARAVFSARPTLLEGLLIHHHGPPEGFMHGHRTLE